MQQTGDVKANLNYCIGKTILVVYQNWSQCSAYVLTSTKYCLDT